ncbi:glycosyltransferase family 2 protein [Staphylococcus equorum]|uniref:Glycosyltransferase family 2 protein n=1 Tax=Staphylococcus equorum TaxID=246432 RepID=A0A9X4L3P3_9STAP|nr:glycosyltransferase family 2 protein [Staphylococcus equorum]MDG0819856.1 glycosyltransferase family 2 protein [Staphylococcus equorum]MDG0840497.1 glycosyltransferase family 2 protein [Staphylococcus equorum]MDG0846180.1 glycosyltransferase family 2 protein [Staphylococcus equorum]
MVTVYNKEPFLENCIQSLINLNIDKSQIEAIFVDDVSTDGSYAILNRYAEQYEFIRAIQLDENSGGPAIPRNIGMQEANGEYLTILDADDWLEAEGFPKLILQMQTHNSDIGFGQCYKHMNNEIRKVANFASYKEANGLVPYEIYNIFRAVGPWGKVFKRSTVIDNNMKFKNLKYGEDKLFYSELISKSQSASMSPEPVYHVNRYADNISLIKSTDMIEKSQFNLDVLKEIIQMELPEYAKEQILCRILEMDFISRFLVTKTFLNSNDKDFFYQQFNEVESVITGAGYEMEKLLINDKYKNVYHTYHHNQKNFVAYIGYMIYEANAYKYIKDHMVYFKYPESFKNLVELKTKCTAIYNGTRLINNTFYEVIELYKQPNIAIEAVKLVKIKDDRFSKKVDFIVENDCIYIKTDDLKFEDTDFNISIQYNGFDQVLVRATYPNFNDQSKLKRQNFHLEFISDKKEAVSLNTDHYLVHAPDHIVVKQEINRYKNTDFNDPLDSIAKGQLIKIKATGKSADQTPLLITNDDLYITADKAFVTEINLNKIEGYVSHIPKSVEVIKKCKLYETISFNNDPIKTLKPGMTLDIVDLAFTDKLTPRLKTSDGYYLTANEKFVDIIN